MEGRKRSIIKTYFTPEICLEIERVTLSRTGSNNTKGDAIERILNDAGVEHTRIGTGTNRLGLLIDGCAVKVALDKDGKIDNLREFRYSKQLQPYVVKVYEVDLNGLLAVTEYVRCFDQSDFLDIANQSEIREILAELADNFLIGDVGISTKNFANWGVKRDGQICMLDFAYIYAISYQTFQCSCGALLRYDHDYVNLVCPRCRKKYTFGAIRKKISKQQQIEEIGDIRTLGYILTKPEEMVELVEELEPTLIEKRKKEEKKLQKRDPLKEELKRYRKHAAKIGLFDKKRRKEYYE